MADKMQFELVSPERSLASLEATEVRIPGAEGDFTAMADHAPVISTLRPGVLTVVSAKGEDSYLVMGGFAEITATGTSVLAERAFAKADVTREIFDTLVSDAKATQENAADKDVAAKFLADLLGAGADIGVAS